MSGPRVTYRRLDGGAYRAVVVEYTAGRRVKLHVLGVVRKDPDIPGWWEADRQLDGRCAWGGFDSRAAAGESLYDDWAADNLPTVARLHGKDARVSP